MWTRQRPILGGVGIDIGARPAISFVIPARKAEDEPVPDPLGEFVLLAEWIGNGSDTDTVAVTGVPNARIALVTVGGNGDGDTGDERMIVTVNADSADISFEGVTALDFDPAGFSKNADASQFVTGGEIDFILDNSHGAEGTFFVDVYGYLT